MIVFDLQCGSRHVFEAWFASSAAYEDQRSRGMLQCPICDDQDIAKAVMAPSVATKGNTAVAISPATAKAMLQTLAGAQAEALNRSRWVGRGFAQEARAMHEGAQEAEPIHGQATRDEARALIDDGVPVAPLPLPIVPPKRVN